MTTNKDIEIVRWTLHRARVWDTEGAECYKGALASLTRIESALEERNGGMMFSGNDTIVPPEGEKP